MFLLERCASLTHSFHPESILKFSLKKSQRNIKHVLHTTAFACWFLGEPASSSQPVTENNAVLHGLIILTNRLVGKHYIRQTWVSAHSLQASKMTKYREFFHKHVPPSLEKMERPMNVDHHHWFLSSIVSASLWPETQTRPIYSHCSDNRV